MGVIRYKIWRDLWENKGRTWRVIAIIAIGAFAVGVVLGAKEFIRQDVTRTWQTSNARLGTVPDMIHRALRDLESEGLIQVERRRIVILDRAGLTAKAQF